MVSAVHVEAAATPIPDHVRDSVARLWLLLGRPPTRDELRAAVRAVVVDGRQLSDMAELLLRADESVVPSPESEPDEFVAALSEAVTGRPASADEVAGWTRQLERGTSAGAMALAFTESRPAVARTGTSPPGPLPALSLEGVSPTTSDGVLRLYVGLLRRLPTRDELRQGVDRVVSGSSLSSVAADILESSEYLARRPASTQRALLAGLYEDVLDRPPDRSGMAAWGALLEDGFAPAEIAVGFTESPEAVDRTGTTEPERLAPAVSGAGVLAVGDSVMLGATNALQESIPGISIDAKVSRQFGDGVSIIAELAESDRLPHTIVFHLGTNGDLAGSRCDELMGMLAGRRVILVNIRVPRPWEPDNNRILAACADRHGAQLVDWHAGATGLASDGVHIGPSGARQYAEMVATALAATAVP